MNDSTPPPVSPLGDPDAAERLWRLWRQGERPDVDAFLIQAGPLSFPEVAAALRVDQRERWRLGEGVPAEAYLARHPDLRSDPEIALDLIFNEYLAREQGGDQPGLEEVLRRFPEHAAVLRVQIELHRAVAAEAGPGSSDRSGDTTDDLSRGTEPGTGVAVSGYEILGEVGRGGMGVIYKARQENLNRLVALKMISAGKHAGPAERARFQTEAEAAARLNHPHIVQIHEVGTAEGVPYLALEFMDRGNLVEALSGKPLVPRHAAELVEVLARALQAAHEQGVLHRDLKPANVLFATPPARTEAEAKAPGVIDLLGVPKVTDFGLAKDLAGGGQTASAAVLGTPGYMAPEQAEGKAKDAGPALDVYGLGAILYECLTGRPPFQGATVLETLDLVRSREPVSPAALRPNLPRDLVTVCLKALAKEPARRYAGAAALAEDLRRFLDDRPVTARRVWRWERAWRWCRRNRGVAALAAAFLLLLLLAAVGGSLAAVSFGRQRDLAIRAEHDRTEQLFHALLAQARAKRRSGQIGQRFDALDALREAARIAHELELDEKYIEDLRTEAIACLALADLKPLHDVPSEGRPEYPIAFDAELERYAHGDAEGVVLLRRTADWELLARLPTPGPGVVGVNPGFSPDGRFLAAGSWRRDSARVVVWELGDGGPPHQALEVEGSGEFAFHPDGRRIAIAQPDATILLCDLSSDGRKKLAASAGAHGLVFRPDGRQLAYVCGDNLRVGILDPDTGDRLPSFDHVDDVNLLAWSGDGRLLAAASDNHNVYVWDVPAHRQQAILEGHQRSVNHLDFHPVSNLLATGGWDMTTRLWDAISGRLLVTADRPLVRFSRDGRRLAFHDGLRLGVWDVAEGRECRVLHHGRVGNRAGWLGYMGAECIDFSLDGRLLASAGGDGVHLWDVAGGAEAGHLTIGHHESLAFHPDGDRLYTHGRTGLRCWPIRADPRHAPGGREVGPPQLLGFAGRGTFRVDVSADGGSLAVSDIENEQAAVLNTGRPAERVAIKCGCPGIHRFALSPDGRHLAVGRAAGKEPIKVWDARRGCLVTVLPNEHGDNVTFSPDGRWLASGGSSEYRLTEVDSWQPGAVFPKDRPEPWDGPIAFSRDGRLLAIARSFQLVQLIEVATRRPLATMTSPDLPCIHWLSFSPDGSRLAAATENQTIHLWDLHAIHEELRPMGLAWEPAPNPPRLPRGDDRVRLAILQDVYEAENLPVVASSGQQHFAQEMQPWGRERWSGGRHLLCRTRKDGYVEFAVDLPRAGRYRLDVWLTRSYDFGVVAVSLDGRKVGAAFDGYHNDVLPPGKGACGVFDLGEGSHRVRFTAVDKNEKSRDYYMGIDCLRLTPVDPPPGAGVGPE